MTGLRFGTRDGVHAAAFLTPLTLVATAAALSILWLYRYSSRLSIDVGWLYAKEGPLEVLTFVGEVLAAGLLGIASARAWSQRAGRPQMAGLALMFSTAALVLFVVGMEEIGWGQQLFHFATPESWARINYQQETTLHNLIDREALTSSARWIAYFCSAAALMAAILRATSSNTYLRLVLPPSILLPLGALIGIAGWKSHPEVIEVLIALYAVCYAWYAYSGRPGPSSAQDQPSSEQLELSGATASRPVDSQQASTKILVTGASGFIGSRLVLHAHGPHQRLAATGMDRTSAERMRIAELDRAGVPIVLGSLQDPGLVQRTVAGCQAVIHLAAAQHEADSPDSYYYDVNVEATRRLLDASVAAGVKRFIYVSTIGVYGGAGGEALLDEHSPVRPDNIYGRSKVQAEEVVRGYANRLEIVIVRVSETYGPGDFRLLKLFSAISRRTFVMIGRGATAISRFTSATSSAGSSS